MLSYAIINIAVRDHVYYHTLQISISGLDSITGQVASSKNIYMRHVRVYSPKSNMSQFGIKHHIGKKLGNIYIII